MSVIEAEPPVRNASSAADPGALSLEEGIAWLRLDDPGKKVNTLSTRLFAWFEEQIARVERERPEGLVIYSGKPDGFVAGADLEELLALTDPLDVIAMLGRGHDLIDHHRFDGRPPAKPQQRHPGGTGRTHFAGGCRPRRPRTGR